MLSKAICITSIGLVGFSASAQTGIIPGAVLPGTGAYITVPGGTFELDDPLTDWYSGFNIGTLTSIASTDIRGARVGRMSSNTIGYYAVNRAVTGLTVGTTYMLSGFFRGEDLGGSVAMDVGNYGGQAWYQTSAFALSMDASTVRKWFFGYVSFVADNPSMTVRLVRNGPTVEGNISYFDDIAVTPVSTFVAPTPVPEPATMIVLGLGVVATLSRRKK